MAKELAKTYDPASVEARLYAEWEKSGVFTPSGDGPAFSIVLPPPNVTGALHMGHGLDQSIPDAVVRRKRMQGFRTLWLPGTDHAGIATQNVVERELAKEGKTRHDLGREKFVERVWEWKEQSGGTITRQMRRLGASVDWSRERFTMDEGLSRAVREVFVRLFDEELIYRGNRITNWCPRCMTALSDIEVEHEDVDGELVELRYPLADGSGSITIATTRVETMLADTGVAVHPSDERYRALVGKTAVLPLSGREIPIVADEAIDPEFGTGALKVTPAHDATDFEIAQRHGLPSVSVIALDGRMSAEAGRFEGLDRFEARKTVLEALRAEGAVGNEVRPFSHAVGHCQRCRTEVEPLLSEQWFVRVQPLARPAIAAVREGRTRVIPPRYERNYFDWMENLRDWCISRQLWWGHRIPVWTCGNGHVKAYREDPASCVECESKDLTQDPDVLDTWFSSALWPFSTLGWPEDTDDLRSFYPTSVLVTGYDIITFWVSRMMMMGIHFMHDVPFRDLHVHGMVRDFRGKKMSKSFGNVIDPLEMIDRYGADAFRMTLTRSATLGGDVPIDEKWIEGDRNFANKLWNTARFVLMNLGGDAPGLPLQAAQSLADRWILSRLAHVTEAVDHAMEEYDFATAAQMLRQFTWSEFADWYIEWAKGPLTSGDADRVAGARGVLAHVLGTVLRLLHPIMPFITEELHSALTGEGCVRGPWPSPAGARDTAAERDFAFVQEVVGALRRFRADHDIAPGVRPAATIAVSDDGFRDVLASELARLTVLARWGDVALAAMAPPASGEARIVVSGAIIHIPVAGLFDVAAETGRLRKEIDKIEADAERIRAKLANEDFVSRAPEEVVETQRERLSEAQSTIGRLEEALRELSS